MRKGGRDSGRGRDGKIFNAHKVTLFKNYQTLQAIENFEDKDIGVAVGNDKKSVTIDTAVQVINAMEKLYMTVVVE